MTAASFEGFGPQTLNFFTALGFHQTREWYEANKPIYEREVRQPMGLLLDDVSGELARRDVPLRGGLKTSMFRLNRDVRFAKDKALYKTNASAVLTRSGTKGEQGLVYIHIDPAGSFVACGVYHPLPAQLAELRGDIRDRAQAYLAACDALAPLTPSQEDRLTRAPKGFEGVTDPRLADALRLRSHVFRQPIANELVFSNALLTQVADFAEQAAPFLRFCWNSLDRVPMDERDGLRKPGQR